MTHRTVHVTFIICTTVVLVFTVIFGTILLLPHRPPTPQQVQNQFVRDRISDLYEVCEEINDHGDDKLSNQCMKDLVDSQLKRP